jgi:hypothetical protein
MALPPCPSCACPLPVQDFSQSEKRNHCPSCDRETILIPFAALTKKASPTHAEEKMDEDASCFQHETKKAVQSCCHCGRYMCGLCDIELQQNLHSCPLCISKGLKVTKDLNLESSRTLHDSIALSMATFPMLIFYFTILTAPITLIYLYTKRKEPGPFISSFRWRRWLACLIAILQIIGWILLFIGIGTYWDSFSAAFNGENVNFDANQHQDIPFQNDNGPILPD